MTMLVLTYVAAIGILVYGAGFPLTSFFILLRTAVLARLSAA